MSGVRRAFRCAGRDLVDPVGKVGQIAVKVIEGECEAESASYRVEIERAHFSGLAQPAECFRECEIRTGDVIA